MSTPIKNTIVSNPPKKISSLSKNLNDGAKFSTMVVVPTGAAGVAYTRTKHAKEYVGRN